MSRFREKNRSTRKNEKTISKIWRKVNIPNKSTLIVKCYRIRRKVNLSNNLLLFLKVNEVWFVKEMYKQIQKFGHLFDIAKLIYS